MFIQNKYTRWYYKIVESAKQTPFRGYTEKHHIIPRSLSGSDDYENLVSLSGRQHFICHWLLTKMTGGQDRFKMINALVMMQAKNGRQNRYKTCITSRVYANIREEYSRYISTMNKGRIQPLDEKNRQIVAMTGRTREPFSKEWLANIKEARQGEKNGMYGKTHSVETRAKQSAKAFGRKQSAETVAKKADAIRGLKREKKLCPYCQKEIAVNGYARWHGDNCKEYKK